MNDAKKTFDPWRLVLILVCAVGFIGGIYLLNLTINTRFDAVDSAVTSGSGTTAMTLDRIDNKLSNIENMMNEMTAKMAPPPPPPAPPADAAAAPAAAPAPEAAPAPAKKE
jgi:hypothetical protein